MAPRTETFPGPLVERDRRAASRDRRERRARDLPGAGARRPGEIPARGWAQILRRVRHEITMDHLEILAAGSGFYLFLSVFPALIAAVSIYGLVADPAQVESQLQALARVAPSGAVEIVRTQLQEIVRSSPESLGWGVAGGILVALWSATRGAKAVIASVNLAYDEEEKRGFLRRQALAFLFTLGFLVFLAVSLFTIAVVPSLFTRLLERFPVSDLAVIAGFWLQWGLLLLFALLALAVVYRYAPSRDEPRWTWVSWGSFVAAALWLVASIGFSWYATRFGSYNETYGAIAGVVLLLLWLQISCFVVLLGAELNAEIEHQTAVDTTEGAPEPMGSRGAVKADTLPDDPDRGSPARRRAPERARAEH